MTAQKVIGRKSESSTQVQMSSDRWKQNFLGPASWALYSQWEAAQQQLYCLMVLFWVL